MWLLFDFNRPYIVQSQWWFLLCVWFLIPRPSQPPLYDLLHLSFLGNLPWWRTSCIQDIFQIFKQNNAIFLQSIKPDLTTALTAAFMPWESPPLVSTPIHFPFSESRTKVWWSTLNGTMGMGSIPGGGLLEKQPRFRRKLGFIGELRGKLAN